MIARGSHWQILNGTKVRLWTDEWFLVLPDGLLGPIYDEFVDDNAFVSEIINPITKKWDLSNLNGSISEHDAQRIKPCLLEEFANLTGWFGPTTRLVAILSNLDIT